MAGTMSTALSIARLLKSTRLALHSSSSTDASLLSSYAEFDLDASAVPKGERGIVVLSPEGETILAQTEEYSTAAVTTSEAEAVQYGLALSAKTDTMMAEVVFDAEWESETED